MKKALLGGLFAMVVVGVAACRDEAAAPVNPFEGEYHRVGSTVAFLDHEPARVVRYDTRSKKLLQPLQLQGTIVSVASSSSGALRDASSPSLAVLLDTNSSSERDGGDRLAIVHGDAPDGIAVEQSVQFLQQVPLPANYHHLLVDGGIAAAVARTARVDPAGAGGASGDDGVAAGGQGTVDPNDLITDAVLVHLGRDTMEPAQPPKPVPLALPGAQRFDQLLVRSTPGDPQTWIALAGSRQVVLMRTLGRGSKFAPQAQFTVDLDQDGRRATRSPWVAFDNNASRLFVWTPNTSDLLWLDLSPEAGPVLSRFRFDHIPADVKLVFTGDTEVIVAVASNPSGGSLVSVFDPFSLRSATLPISTVADTILELDGGSLDPDTVVFYGRNPANPRDGFGMARVESLAEPVLNATAEPAPDVVTLVSLPAPHVGITVVDVGHLLIESEDDSAAVYDVGAGEARLLPDWNERTRLVAISGGHRGIIADEREADGTWLLRAYDADGVVQVLDVPGPVRAHLSMGPSAHALMHTSALGLLTYLDTRDSEASYTASGFLIPELVK